MGLGDLYEGPAPQLWYGTLGMPRGAEVAARAFDGVLLTCCMTPTATQQAVQRLCTACERIGRDPATLRIAQCVITAPDLADEETRELVHARCLTYLQAPDFGRWLVRLNGWDPGVRERLISHPLLRPDRGLIDHARHRAEMGELASLVPDEWMRESSAMGSAAECVTTLQQFRDAGADELVTYGSTPAQNAQLASLWRRASSSIPRRVAVT
jgi:probable F420-dependent oxidoreductase